MNVGLCVTEGVHCLWTEFLQCHRTLISSLRALKQWESKNTEKPKIIKQHEAHLL